MYGLTAVRQYVDRDEIARRWRGMWHWHELLPVMAAEIVLVDGLISDAAGMAGERARADGWFDLSMFKEPYRPEGIAYGRGPDN